MTDEADGDRNGDPSDAPSEEEDPFIYPLADDEGTESAEEAGDVDAADAGDTAETGDATDAGPAAAGGTDASAAGSADAGHTSGSGAGPSTDRPGGERDRTTGRTASSSTRSSTGTGSTASTGTSSATGGTTSTGAPRRTTDPGRRATDGRTHASAGGQSHQPGRRTPGEGHSRRDAGGGPPGAPAGTGREGVSGWLRWFWRTEEGSAVYVRDVVTSVAAVLLVGLVLFAVSGVWPPMVAVESGSMEPSLQVGDLVFVVDNERFAPDAAVEHDGRTTGIVPADVASETGRSSFGGPGDVVVYRPGGDNGTTPVIHRAMLWVEADENWYERADPAAVGDASNCRELNHCPAPHAGFITKGDANRRYDQQTTLSAPVRPEWIVGTAEVRIPYLGHIRLAFAGQVAPPLQQGHRTAVVGEAAASPTASPTTPPTVSASESPTPPDPPGSPGSSAGPANGTHAGTVV